MARVDAICALSLLFGLSFAPRAFSLGTFLNSNSTRNLVDEEPLCGRATSKTLLYLKEAKTCLPQSFPSSFACFSANSGYKGMFRLVDILQTAAAIRRDVFLQFLLRF